MNADTVWRAVAELLAKGFSTLHPSARWGILVGGVPMQPILATAPTGGFQVTWNSVPGENYELDRATNLLAPINWTPVQIVTAISNTEIARVNVKAEDASRQVAGPYETEPPVPTWANRTSMKSVLELSFGHVEPAVESRRRSGRSAC